MAFFLRTSLGMIAVGFIAGQAPVVTPVETQPEPLIDPLPLSQPPSVPLMPRILNDTPEYCEALREDIASIQAKRGDIPAHAAKLTVEGERMCRIGHIKPGIYRLRWALKMLRHRNEQTGDDDPN